MPMMAVSILILFAVGFAGGYAAREALSWFRRTRLKRQKAEKLATMQMGQAGVAVAQASPSRGLPMGRANA
jgi:hypothetical protein